MQNCITVGKKDFLYIAMNSYYRIMARIFGGLKSCVIAGLWLDVQIKWYCNIFIIMNHLIEHSYIAKN